MTGWMASAVTGARRVGRRTAAALPLIVAA
jgi:hypothetical protein